MDKRAFAVGFENAVKTAIDVSRLQLNTAQRERLRSGAERRAGSYGYQADMAHGDAAKDRAHASEQRAQANARALAGRGAAPVSAGGGDSTRSVRAIGVAGKKPGFVAHPDAKTVIRGTMPHPTREAVTKVGPATAGLGDRARAAARSAMGTGGSGAGAVASAGRDARHAALGRKILENMRHSDPAVRERARSAAKMFQKLRAAT